MPRRRGSLEDKNLNIEFQRENQARMSLIHRYHNVMQGKLESDFTCRGQRLSISMDTVLLYSDISVAAESQKRRA